jgi:hypothetical protein
VTFEQPRAPVPVQGSATVGGPLTQFDNRFLNDQQPDVFP